MNPKKIYPCWLIRSHMPRWIYPKTWAIFTLSGAGASPTGRIPFIVLWMESPGTDDTLARSLLGHSCPKAGLEKAKSNFSLTATRNFPQFAARGLRIILAQATVFLQRSARLI